MFKRDILDLVIEMLQNTKENYLEANTHCDFNRSINRAIKLLKTLDTSYD